MNRRSKRLPYVVLVTLWGAGGQVKELEYTTWAVSPERAASHIHYRLVRRGYLVDFLSPEEREKKLSIRVLTSDESVIPIVFTPRPPRPPRQWQGVLDLGVAGDLVGQYR